MRRVAITGMGAICALGRNTAELAEALREGRFEKFASPLGSAGRPKYAT